MIRALTGCRFGGKDYRKGDTVPDSAVDKKNIGALVRMKIIAVTADPVVKSLKFNVTTAPLPQKPKKGQKK